MSEGTYSRRFDLSPFGMKSQFDAEAIERALKASKTKREFQKVQCIWLSLTFQMKSKEIALAIGWSAVSVRKAQSFVAKEGIQSISDRPRGGRRRAYISVGREKQILNKFERRARRGFALDLKQIKKAYELSVGRTVALSTIYRLVERHGLRRFLPKVQSSKQNSTANFGL